MEKFSFFTHYVRDVVHLSDDSLATFKKWFADNPAVLEEASDVSLLEWCKAVGSGRAARSTLSITTRSSRRTLRAVLAFLGEVDEGIYFHAMRDRADLNPSSVRVEGTFSFPDALIDADTVARAYRFRCLFVIVKALIQILNTQENE